MILQSGKDVGPKEIVDHPSCVTPFRVAPGDRFEWMREGAVGPLEKGLAKVSIWAKIVDPTGCDRKHGCYDFSLTTTYDDFQARR